MEQDTIGLEEVVECFDIDIDQALQMMSRYQSKRRTSGISHLDVLILYRKAVLELIQVGPTPNTYLISLTELRKKMPYQYSDRCRRKLWLTWLCKHFPIFDVVAKSNRSLTHITLRIKS